ncbi:MAG: isoprenylcysteine carboxylmethyltransferase family protein [Acholeplasmataceae bacterium]|nr:isoprenylcysteine carboxylmethyltransferase family protein [Acholeplasmataceae bacterium]
MNNDIHEKKFNHNKLIQKRVMFLLAELVFGMLVLILVSGDIKYFGAWYLGALYLISMIAFAFGLPKHVIILRATKNKNTPTYEKIIGILMFICGYATYVVAALDHRFSWSYPLTWYMLLIAGFIFLIGMGIVLWSMIENPFFSQKVTRDQKIQIIDKGPYGVIRHPGYLGMMTYLTVAPIILESIFAMIPTVVLIVLFIIRTHKEDHYLEEHVEGYKDYQKRVPQKLFRTYK